MVKYDIFAGQVYDVAISHKDSRPMRGLERRVPQNIIVVAMREKGDEKGWRSFSDFNGRVFEGLVGRNDLEGMKNYLRDLIVQKYTIDSLVFSDSLDEAVRSSLEQKYGGSKP